MARVTTIFLGGDAMLARPWSEERDSAFARLIETMRASDVTILNLETTIHDFDCHAQADPGGTWMRSPPEIAGELGWAGVDMVCHANNHSFDYGSTGILRTHAHVEAAGLRVAGSGRDLQEAAAPRYGGPADSVALVAAASSFTSYGRASSSGWGVAGRPGVNPLGVVSKHGIAITSSTARRMRRAASAVGFAAERFTFDRFKVGPLPFHVEDRHKLVRGTGLDDGDRTRSLTAVREAREKAEIVLYSLHAHRRDRWLRGFAHDVIDAGADVVFAHGPHRVLGVERYRQRPIFYGLGDFAFEPHLVERLPAEAYERWGLGEHANVDDVNDAETAGGTRGFPVRRETWEGIGVQLDVADGRVGEVRIVPVDLGFSNPWRERGRPRWADAALGREIVATVASRSRCYGTRVDWVESEGFGRVR